MWLASKGGAAQRKLFPDKASLEDTYVDPLELPLEDAVTVKGFKQEVLPAFPASGSGFSVNAALLLLTHACFAAASLAAMLVPSMLAGQLFNLAPEAAVLAASDELLVRMAGACLLPVVSSMAVLWELVAAKAASSASAVQLSCGLFTHCVLSVVVLFQAESLRLGSPWMAPMLGAAWGVPLLLSVKLLIQSGPGLNLKSLLKASISVLQPLSPTAAIYGVMGSLTAAAGAMVFFLSSPGADLYMLSAPMGPVGTFAARVAGAGLIAAGANMYTLKEASDRELLGAKIPSLLNTGIAACAVAIVAFILRAQVGSIVASKYSIAALVGTMLLMAWTGSSAVLGLPWESSQNKRKNADVNSFADEMSRAPGYRSA